MRRAMLVVLLCLIPVAASAKATEMDKCMDAVYIATGIGGGLHRHFDGWHTLYGATKCAALLKNKGLLAKIVAMSKGLYKDFITPQGLPLVTLNKMRVERLRGPLSRIGLSTETIYALNTFTPLKLGVTVLTAAVIAHNWTQIDTLDKYNVIAEAFTIAGLLGVNVATLNAIGIVASMTYAAEFLARKGVWKILSRLTVSDVSMFFDGLIRLGVRGVGNIVKRLRGVAKAFWQTVENVKQWTARQAVVFGHWTEKQGRHFGRWTERQARHFGRWTERQAREFGRWVRKAL